MFMSGKEPNKLLWQQEDIMEICWSCGEKEFREEIKKCSQCGAGEKPITTIRWAAERKEEKKEEPVKKGKK